MRFIVILVLLGISAPAFAWQGKTPAPSPAKPAATGGLQGAPATDPTALDRNNKEMTSAVVLYGKVMLSDGSAPPEGIEVQYSCHNRAEVRSNVDKKGNFRLDLSGLVKLNTRQDSLPQSLVDCDVRVQDPRFPLARLDLTGLRLNVSTELPPIVLRTSTRAENALVSVNSLKAPSNASKAFADGKDFAAKQQFAEAKASYEKAAKLYPEYSAAWYEIGMADIKLGDIPAAKTAFQTSAEKDPSYVSPQLQLALLAMRDQDWKTAKERSANILTIDPDDFPHVYLINGGACFNLKEVDAAEKSVRRGIEIDKDKKVPRLYSLLGMILASKNDNAGAAQAYRDYLAAVPQAPDAERVKAQIASLEARSAK
jgi:tetratricopeptide (TPR) repeat protein